MDYTNTNRINFLKLKDPYGFLSNFWVCDLEWNGLIYPSSEHLYQARKYEETDPEFSERIRLQSSAWKAAKLGRTGENLHPQWMDIRLQIMKETLWIKFTQNLELAQELLATGDALLVEHFAKDRFWASGGDDTGENHLGQLLMEVRSELPDYFRTKK